MVLKKAIENSFWIPIDAWNLNELFTTESISPISFYKERSFGNPVNRNEEKIEDQNNLILFDKAVQSDILLRLSSDLLSSECLKEIKYKKKGKLRCFEYSKTIYLKNGHFNLYFRNQNKLSEFLNNTFMLLEVKTVNKYKSNFVVDERISENGHTAIYQSQILSNKNKTQPFFDKAFNQFKGLLYGYFIGSIGMLGENEQALVADLSKLKNTIAGSHTDIVMADEYSNVWLINVQKRLESCQKLYGYNFGSRSDVLDTLSLRLEEIDNLNKMRCSDLQRQKSSHYIRDYEIELESLENAKRELYKYELRHEISPLKEELAEIKKEEESNGKVKGKTREYFKKGSYEYNRKRDLKQFIADLENNYEYQELRKVIEIQEGKVRNFQFGFTQFDTSISEQFSRISEYLHEIIKKSTSYFLSKSSQSTDVSDFSFEIDIAKLGRHYFNLNKEYTDFSFTFPEYIKENLTDSELTY